MRRWLGCLLLLLALPGSAVERTASEAEVKAALVYNLLLFVQWPADRLPADGSLRLCVLAPAGDGFEQLAGKLVHNRPLALRRIAGSSEELQQCQAAWVEEARSALLGRLALAARSNGLLVLGEGAAALAQGAMIAVSTEGGRLVFSVDHGAAKEARLAVSSKLLRLAHSVVDNSHE